MKITRIAIRNILGARSVDIRPAAPVLLVAGCNGAGKSSAQEAVRMAFTGETVRVSLKKEYGALVTEGEKAGLAMIEFDGGRASVALPSGAHEVEGGPLPAALPFVLDAQRFARLDTSERRFFLFGLLGVETTHTAIAERLKQRGCDTAKIEAVIPILRAGLDAGHKHAKEMTSQARGAWKAVTGESYGDKKAEGWAAFATEPVTAEAMQAAENTLKTCAANIDAAHSRFGAMNAEVARARQQAARIADLTARAEKIERIKDKLDRDQSELDQWTARLAELPPAPGAADPRPALSCPDCGVALVMTAGKLEHYTAPQADDMETAGKRKQWQDAVTLYGKSVTNDKRDLADAQAAAAALKEIADEPVPSEQEFAAATRELDLLKADRQKCSDELSGLRARKLAAEAAEGKTKAAGGHHADVQQWSAIAEALSPDGIQAEMIAEALDPLNKQLAEHASLAQWATPRVGADMAITANGRPYPLLSESERFRIDALITVCIAHLSGLRLVVLDRVDVLDLTGREDLLYWLSDLAGAGQIDTAILMATLKAAPKSLPPHCASQWIEGGVVQQQTEKVMEAA